jgi:hypothetical protein
MRVLISDGKVVKSPHCLIVTIGIKKCNSLERNDIVIEKDVSG